MKSIDYIDDDDVCTICLENIVNNNFIETICKHKFHRNCYLKLKDNKCPNCRNTTPNPNYILNLQYKKFEGNIIKNPESYISHMLYKISYYNDTLKNYKKGRKFAKVLFDLIFDVILYKEFLEYFPVNKIVIKNKQLIKNVFLKGEQYKYLINISESKIDILKNHLETLN